MPGQAARGRLWGPNIGSEDAPGPLFDSDHHHLGFSHACVASLRTSPPFAQASQLHSGPMGGHRRRHGPPPALGRPRSSHSQWRDLRPLRHSEAPSPLPPSVASGAKTLNLNAGGPLQEASGCTGKHASPGPQRRETRGEPSLSKGGSTWHTGYTPLATMTWT